MSNIWKKHIERLNKKHDLQLMSVVLYNNQDKDIEITQDEKCTSNNKCTYKSDNIKQILNNNWILNYNISNKKFIPHQINYTCICKICHCKWSQFNRIFIKKLLNSIIKIDDLISDIIIKYIGSCIIWNNENMIYSLIKDIDSIYYMNKYTKHYRKY